MVGVVWEEFPVSTKSLCFSFVLPSPVFILGSTEDQVTNYRMSNMKCGRTKRNFSFLHDCVTKVSSVESSFCFTDRTEELIYPLCPLPPFNGSLTVVCCCSYKSLWCIFQPLLPIQPQRALYFILAQTLKSWVPVGKSLFLISRSFSSVKWSGLVRNFWDCWQLLTFSFFWTLPHKNVNSTHQPYAEIIEYNPAVTTDDIKSLTQYVNTANKEKVTNRMILLNLRLRQET